MATTNEDDEEFIKKKDLFILEIGRFAVTFEQIVSYVRESITNIFILKGLNDPEFAKVILGDINAEPLRQTFEKIVPFYFKRKADKELIKEILPQLNLLIQIRNRIIHCHWIIGVIKSDPPELPIGIGLRQKVTSKGVKFYKLEIEYNQIIKLTSDTRKFERIMYQFQRNIFKKKSLPDNIPIEDLKNLRFNEILNELMLNI